VDWVEQRPGLSRKGKVAIFAIYLGVLLYILLIPNFFRGGMVLVGGLTWDRWLGYVRMNFSFIPFRSLIQQFAAIATGNDSLRILVYLVGNVVGFIPIGLSLPQLFPSFRRLNRLLLTLLGGILVVELIQALAMRGTFDIDDIIINLSGTLIGFSHWRNLNSRRNVP